MALSQSITVKDAAAADKVFVETSRNQKRVERTKTGSTVVSRETMVIDHGTFVPKGSPHVSDKHTVQFERTVPSDAGPRARTRVYLVVESTQDPAMAAGAVADQWAYLTDIMNNAGFIDSLLLGES